jgi:hypothetical protein
MQSKITAQVQCNRHTPLALQQSCKNFIIIRRQSLLIFLQKKMPASQSLSFAY